MRVVSASVLHRDGLAPGLPPCRCLRRYARQLPGEVPLHVPGQAQWSVCPFVCPAEGFGADAGLEATGQLLARMPRVFQDVIQWPTASTIVAMPIQGEFPQIAAKPKANTGNTAMGIGMGPSES